MSGKADQGQEKVGYVMNEMVAYMGLLTGLYVGPGCQCVFYVGPKNRLGEVYYMFMHLEIG